MKDQVYVIPKGVDRRTVADDMARLSTMPEAYNRLYAFDPVTKTWLYTALAKGLHTSWPGHGGYPPEYDPRERQWYVDAMASEDEGEPTWTVLPDVSSRTIALTCSMVINGPDGKPAGVTRHRRAAQERARGTETADGMGEGRHSHACLGRPRGLSRQAGR